MNGGVSQIAFAAERSLRLLQTSKGAAGKASFMNALCLTMVGVLAVGTVLGQEKGVAPLHPAEREGAATIIHRADVIRDTSSTNRGAMHLWPLYSSAESRMNYVEVTGPSGLHFHPDADHKLYVLEGALLVTAGTNTTTAIAGDLIIIPKGVRHRYDVPAKGGRALLLTFDAPPYDPKQTVNLETKAPGPGQPK